MRIALPLPLGALRWAGVAHIRAEAEELAQQELDNLPARLPGIQGVVTGLRASVRAGDWRVVGSTVEADMTVLITWMVARERQLFAQLEVTAAVRLDPNLLVFKPARYLDSVRWQLKVESRGDPARQYLLANPSVLQSFNAISPADLMSEALGGVTAAAGLLGVPFQSGWQGLNRMTTPLSVIPAAAVAAVGRAVSPGLFPAAITAALASQRRTPLTVPASVQCWGIVVPVKKLARVLSIRVSRMEVVASSSFEGLWVLLDVDAGMLLVVLLLAAAWIMLWLALKCAWMVNWAAYACC